MCHKNIYKEYTFNLFTINTFKDHCYLQWKGYVLKTKKDTWRVDEIIKIEKTAGNSMIVEPIKSKIKKIAYPILISW